VALITEIHCEHCDFRTPSFTPAIYLVDLTADELDVARERLDEDLFHDGRLIAASPLFDESARRATGKTIKELRAEGRVHLAWPVLCNACGHLNDAIGNWPLRTGPANVIDWAKKVRCRKCGGIGGTPANPDTGRRLNSPCYWLALALPVAVFGVTRSVGWTAGAFFGAFALAVVWDDRHARALRAHLAATKCPSCGREGLREDRVGIS
jgi:hypothetical protein